MVRKPGRSPPLVPSINRRIRRLSPRTNGPALRAVLKITPRLKVLCDTGSEYSATQSLPCCVLDGYDPSVIVKRSLPPS
jgi:hypothetical protein